MLGCWSRATASASPGNRAGIGVTGSPRQEIFSAQSAVEPDLPGLVDDAHAAAAQLGQDLDARNVSQAL